MKRRLICKDERKEKKLSCSFRNLQSGISEYKPHVTASILYWQSAHLYHITSWKKQKTCSYSKPWPHPPPPCPLFQPVTLKLRLAVMRRMGWPVTWMAWRRRRSARKTCAWSMPRGPRWTAHSRAPKPRPSPRPAVSGCPTGSSSAISVG